MKKKVLIIAYYWPPSGGSGVQRWLKFVKYMPQAGGKPYVFTPENPAFAIRDESLLQDVPPEAEVIHFPIWEPYEIFFRIGRVFGSRKTAKPTEVVSLKDKSFFQTLSTWVRGNLFIPDPRRFWVRPSVNYLQEFLAKNSIDTIITTGPPHSIHLIGYHLKKKNPALKWLADFRDPWSEWGFLDTIKAGKTARKLHRKLEAKVLATADAIITITPFYVRRFEVLAKRNVHLLTNGYDEDDFKNMVIRKAPKFIIRHAGIVNEKCNPRPFMNAVLELLTEVPSFREKVSVDFVGDVHPTFRQFVTEIPGLAGITTFTPSIPHKRMIAAYGESAILLLVLTGYKDAEGYMPGKLFEYLATGLPILGVGPEQGDAAKLLKETNAGQMIDSSKTAAIRNFLLEKFDAWEKSSSPPEKPSGVERYSRRVLTKTLMEMI
jgi:glycosyltransferase involved in cell wall biosynthesis